MSTYFSFESYTYFKKNVEIQPFKPLPVTKENQITFTSSYQYYREVYPNELHLVKTELWAQYKESTRQS